MSVDGKSGNGGESDGDATDSAHFNSLIRQRGVIKGKVTRFTTFVNGFDLGNNAEIPIDRIFQIETRVASLSNDFDNFTRIQTEIRAIENDGSDDDPATDAFEESYFNAVGRARALLASHTEQNRPPPSSNQTTHEREHGSITSNNNLANQIRLPRIELSKFSGGFDAWVGFRDTYDALIHSNQSLTGMQKYHYLRASLGGDAAEVIKGIEFGAANYEAAWTLLCNRYNNTRGLVHNHLNALLNLPVIAKESSHALRTMVDSIGNHLGTLKVLKQPTDHWDVIVIHIMIKKLDLSTTREWETRAHSEQHVTLEYFLKFLQERASILETLETKKGTSFDPRNRVPYNRAVKSFTVTTVRKCFMCDEEEHYTSNCPQLLALSVEERLDKVRKLNLCFNCLRKGHSSQQCRSARCKQCGGRHNSILHFERVSNSNSLKKEQDGQNSASVTSVTATLGSTYMYERGLIPTASILVKGCDGTYHEFRALLDAGAQTNFVSYRLIGQLGVKTRRTPVQLNGIGLTESCAQETCIIQFKSRNRKYGTSLHCHVLADITNAVPTHQLEIDVPNNLPLADPTFNRPGPIDVLFGAGIFWELLEPQQIKLGLDKPILKNSKFGWLVSGPTIDRHEKIAVNLINVDVQSQLAKFWELEEVSNLRVLSRNEEIVESHFKDTYKRKDDGRFIVEMPLSDNPCVLGDSLETAKKRFMNLERKLIRNSSLYTRYKSFMQEYIELNHMAETNSAISHETQFYIPHHGVLNEDKQTTKLRVVFDASAKSTSGISLNDIQRIGPVIQDDLLSIMLRFRLHNYVISADITKMYRQVEIAASQRCLQKIVWRDDVTKPLKHYALNTVTYGTASGSYQAIRCLHETANEIEASQPIIARTIRNDFYVDDLLTGTSTIEEAVNICVQTTDALSKACFPLRKWMTNEPRILTLANLAIQEETREFANTENAKTLGLLWSQKEDVLSYRVKKHANLAATKRILLSIVSQIFDPLGLLAPVTIKAKIFLQKLWSLKLDWDDDVPDNLCVTWNKFYENIACLANLKVPRQVVLKQYSEIELHGFSDASELAYGACVYVRTVRNNEICVQLLTAKTRVAPLQTITIPRLELCGAQLLAKIVNKVTHTLPIAFDSITLWTDSTIVLGWLKTDSSQLKTFVGHRVATIQTITQNMEWKHISTHENPADVASRGIYPEDLKATKIWWYGPAWISQSKSLWPITKAAQIDLPEIKTSVCANVVTESDGSRVIDFDKYSSYSKLERITAYILRFLYNCKIKEGKREGNLTHLELRKSCNTLIKLGQQRSFNDDIAILNQRKDVKSMSRLSSLCPFIDKEGILRVGGRLKLSEYSVTKKHPALLCAKHPLAILIMRYLHHKHLHVGPQGLLNISRERIWIIGGRNLARKVVHQCVSCCRARPKIIQPMMGQLPTMRTSPEFPFLHCGLDYAGPIILKTSNVRNCKTYKAYIGIFVCMVTKAMHLELITGLTTQAFIAALRRFVSRRGIPAHVYSDNGTNFVGAKSELKELHSFLRNEANEVSANAAGEQFEWHFIPARAPNFGGIWEAGVRAVKSHLKRVVAERLLTYEDFSTLLVQIEGILNSRPLSAMSTDPNDLSPLTPAHFLIGRSMITVADPDLLHISETRLSSFQKTQAMVQHFWARWKREYLHQMQGRPKWKKQPKHEFKVGALVLIVDEGSPPMAWKMGRIIKIYPGKDDIIRVVSIRTAKGVLQRPVSKIALLPEER